MKHSSIHFITVLRESYVFGVFFFCFLAFSMRFLRLNSRWFLAFRAFWQPGLSQYSCLLLYIDGKRRQSIEIHYNGVGILREPSPEEMEEMFQEHMKNRKSRKSSKTA